MGIGDWGLGIGAAVRAGTGHRGDGGSRADSRPARWPRGAAPAGFIKYKKSPKYFPN